MKCYVCGSKLIWGGDHDSESGDFAVETNLSCPDCNAFVLVSWGEREPDSVRKCGDVPTKDHRVFAKNWVQSYNAANRKKRGK